MDAYALKRALENMKTAAPLVHCITNYVTVNDCANAVLAVGASPIMSDEPYDVQDITTLCNALVLNIGTLNKRTIRGMKIAGDKATDLGRTIVLDPVGAGASRFRTQVAGDLLDANKVTVIRGNMSEMKALSGQATKTRGVDVNPDDAVTDANLVECAHFAQKMAKDTGAVVAITGAIDIVANADTAYAIRNGSPLMGRITGSGCMLSCITAAFATANKGRVLDATVAAVSGMGIAGEIAAERMKPGDGNATFRTYLIDALYNLNADQLEQRAKIQEVK